MSIRQLDKVRLTLETDHNANCIIKLYRLSSKKCKIESCQFLT